MDAAVGNVAPVESLVGIPHGAFDQAVSGRERLHDRAILPGAAAGVKRSPDVVGSVRLTARRAGPTVAQTINPGETNVRENRSAGDARNTADETVKVLKKFFAEQGWIAP